MFTEFYKKIIIPARGWNDSNSACSPGYFWNTNQEEQQTILANSKDIYDNYLTNYTTPTGTTGERLVNLSTSYQNIDGTNIKKLYTIDKTLGYYDKNNKQWVSSSTNLSNYFKCSNNGNNSIFLASGIGTPTGKSPYLAILYSDALVFSKNPIPGTGLAGSDYIMIGTGTTANTSSTYKLESPVSAADCNISATRTMGGYSITIVNKKNTALAISELGYCVCAAYSTDVIYSDNTSGTGNTLKVSDIPVYWNGAHNINTFTDQGLTDAGTMRIFPNSNYYVECFCKNPMLCCRTVLPNPVTIPIGERITITWNFELNY